MGQNLAESERSRAAQRPTPPDEPLIGGQYYFSDKPFLENESVDETTEELGVEEIQPTPDPYKIIYVDDNWRASMRWGEAEPVRENLVFDSSRAVPGSSPQLKLLGVF